MNTNVAIQEKGAAFVKAEAIAQKYAITATCVRLWAKAGKIPSVRFEGCVRFDPEAVAAVIEGSNRKETVQ